MSLQKLEEHIPSQTHKISQFINEPCVFANFVEPAHTPSWATFINSIWGDASAIAPLEPDIDVEAEGDGNLNPPPPGLRSEYEEAEQAVLQALVGNADAFLVFGQYGIGKSLFLVWLLIRRLSLRLPTALQLFNGEAILFHEGGTSVFGDLEDPSHYVGLKFTNPSSRIWVLVDSNATLLNPAPVFTIGRPFFVVEAASNQYRFEWAKKVLATYFCMKTWAFSEVLQVYVTLLSGVYNAHYFCIRPFLGLSHGGPHDEFNLRYLYDNYRPTTRALARYSSNPEEFKNRVVEQVKQMTPDSLRAALRTPDSDETLITRIEPSSTTRSLSKKTIASPGVFVLIWNQHLRNRVYDAAYFYDVFQQGGSVTSSAAGWIFEFRMHHLLTQGHSMAVFPLRCNANRDRKFDVYDNYTDSHKRRNATRFKLGASSEYPLDSGVKLQVNQYYRPEVNDCCMIHFLLLIRPNKKASPILLMFHMKRSQDGHDVKEAGLKMINRLKLPAKTRRYYVVVTPLGIEPSIRVPEGVFKGVQVFHYPVDPNALFPPVGSATPSKST